MGMNKEALSATAMYAGSTKPGEATANATTKKEMMAPMRFNLMSSHVELLFITNSSPDEVSTLFASRVWKVCTCLYARKDVMPCKDCPISVYTGEREILSNLLTSVLVFRKYSWTT